MSLSVSVADYGVGNLFSISRSLEMCGAEVEIVSDMSELLDAECIVFPGVGAFDKTMERLSGLKDDIKRKVLDGTPLLGICIGMQILFDSSAEGTSEGLGIIPGKVVPVEADVVPHMGWNTVYSDDGFFQGLPDDKFYFAHSFRACPDSDDCIRAYTNYHGMDIPVYFRVANVCATQFHPEKSSDAGTAFLKRFIDFAEGCL